MKKSIKSLLLSMAFIAALSVGVVSCSNEEEPEVATSITEVYTGKYTGTITLDVAGQYSYSTAVANIVVEGTDETISVTFPEYSLAGTMMGNMTLGSVTIDGLEYNESKGGFYRDYGGEGITQTMNWATYPLNSPCSILVVKDAEGNLTIQDTFILGKMPMPLTVNFKGRNDEEN